jgi:hypothetical protein
MVNVMRAKFSQFDIEWMDIGMIAGAEPVSAFCMDAESSDGVCCLTNPCSRYVAQKDAALQLLGSLLLEAYDNGSCRPSSVFFCVKH